jgi:hypothetical protein
MTMAMGQLVTREAQGGARVLGSRARMAENVN